MIRRLTLALILLFSFASSACAGQGMGPGPGIYYVKAPVYDYFGVDEEGWIIDGAARTQDAAHDGSWSIYGDNGQWWDGESGTYQPGAISLYVDMTVQAGNTVSVWYKMSAGDHIEFNPQGQSIWAGIIADNTWRKAVFAVPTTASGAAWLIFYAANSSSGRITGYIDSFSITPP